MHSGDKDSSGIGPKIDEMLLAVVVENAELLTREWIQAIRASPATRSYTKLDEEELYRRAHFVYTHIGDWLKGDTVGREEMRRHYAEIGRRRREEGFRLADVVEALLLTKRGLLAFMLKRRLPDVSRRAYDASGGAGDFMQVVLSHVIRMLGRVDEFFDHAVSATVAGFEGGGDET